MSDFRARIYYELFMYFPIKRVRDWAWYKWLALGWSYPEIVHDPHLDRK